MDTNSFHIAVEISDAASNKIQCIGSGAKAFEAAVLAIDKPNRPLDPLAICREIVASERVMGVGGHLQMAVATSDNFELRYIASPDDEDPDKIKISLVGFDLRHLGNIEGFNVGYRAIGLGTEKVMGRQALRAKGVDPDAGPVSGEFQNLAAIEAALAYLVEHQPTSPEARCKLSGQYTLSSTMPKEGIWYIVSRCRSCGTVAPVCLDPSNGSIPKPFSGLGALKVSCMSCGQTIVAKSDELEAAIWAS